MTSPLGAARGMVGRDMNETNRVSTPLELPFDLTFVVAIAAVASQLHHAVGAHHAGPGLLAMWLRAAREHPERRRTALRNALGIGVVQVLWPARLALPMAWSLPTFFLLMAMELTIPVWAAKLGHTPWYAHHISERYGLFTIIVLGECVLGGTNAVAGVIAAQGWTIDVALVGLDATSLILALWWLHRYIVRGPAQLGWAWGAALAILLAVVVAVALGLPLAWAIPAITLAPAVIIVVIEKGRRARPDLAHS